MSMADPAMEHHCLKGIPDVGELRTILVRQKKGLTLRQLRPLRAG